jgi:hypothetical protein
MAWSAGKIFLKARSPVAPKRTNASEIGSGMANLIEHKNAAVSFRG